MEIRWRSGWRSSSNWQKLKSSGLVKNWLVMASPNPTTMTSTQMVTTLASLQSKFTATFKQVSILLSKVGSVLLLILGETLVEHNAMDMVVVPHDCDAEGCFVLDVKYSAPNDQIQALIQLSQSCSQSIDFGCFLAPLSLEGTDYGWWRDKNGKQ